MPTKKSIAALENLFANQPYPHRESWEQEWAAVGVVFREHQGRLELLFIERAEHPGDAWSGHMAFPGGRREDNETIHQTVVRECQEEVGLDLQNGGHLIGYLPPIRAFKQGKAQDFALIPVGFILTEPQTLVPEPAEVADTFWFDLQWLFDRANHSRFKYSHSEGEILLPCIPLKQNKIWGLTYKVIDFLQSRMPQN